MYWILGGVILIIILTIINFLRINLTGQIIYNQQNHLVIMITLSVLHMQIYERYIQIESDHEEKLIKLLFNDRLANNYVKKQFQAHEFILIILKNININKISWNTVVGTGEAGSTGISCGGLWAVKGYMIGLLSSYRALDCTPEMIVAPCFNERRLETEIYCIGTIPVGKAINILFRLRKNKKRNAD